MQNRTLEVNDQFQTVWPAENISNNFYKIEIINQYSINTIEYLSSYGEKLRDGHFVWSNGKEYVGNFKAGWMEGYGELK